MTLRGRIGRLEATVRKLGSDRIAYYEGQPIMCECGRPRLMYPNQHFIGFISPGSPEKWLYVGLQPCSCEKSGPFPMTPEAG